jgi:hypothetical protein
LTPGELDQMKAVNPKTPKQINEEAAFDKFLQGDDSAEAEAERDHHH